MSSRSFKIITLGCKVNQYESASLRDSLISEGFREAGRDEKADIVLVNTCIVTQKASYQSRQSIRRALKENPSGMTAAIGCYAQTFPDELSSIRGLRLIAGNTVKGELTGILGSSSSSPTGKRGQGEEEIYDKPLLISKDFKPNTPFQCLPIKGFLGRTRAFLKIQDGCQSFCSYCIVPFARGPLRSLAPSRVLSMLNSLSDEGFHEVVLTGIHLGKYGFDLDGKMDLKGLLRLIGEERLSIRIRLSSIEPKEIDEELIGIVATEEWLCRHFHVPLQSGDNSILKRMNRNYSAQEFGTLIERLHKRIPLVSIGVDAMTGFPGEDERAYKNTLNLIEDMPVSYLHVFPFSPRKGTAAAGFSGQVDQKVIKERAARLRRLGQGKKEAFYRSCLGKEFMVLAEGWESEERKRIKGLSDNYLKVIFPSHESIKNEIVPVVMEKLMKNAIIGRPCYAASLRRQALF